MKIAKYYIATEHSEFVNTLYIESAESRFDANSKAESRLRQFPYGRSFLFTSLNYLKRFLALNKGFHRVTLK